MLCRLMLVACQLKLAGQTMCLHFTQTELLAGTHLHGLQPLFSRSLGLSCALLCCCHCGLQLLSMRLCLCVRARHGRLDRCILCLLSAGRLLAQGCKLLLQRDDLGIPLPQLFCRCDNGAHCGAGPDWRISTMLRRGRRLPRLLLCCVAKLVRIMMYSMVLQVCGQGGYKGLGRGFSGVRRAT